MDIGDRIRNRREQLGISVEGLASKLGKNRATIYRYESHQIENLPLTLLEPLAKELKTTPGFLMGWDSATQYHNIFPIETKKIPMLGTIAAGEPIHAEEDFSYYVELGSEIQADYCLKVSGDSMINARIHDGDIVFIRKQTSVNDGEIAAVLIDNEATLKRVYYNEDSITLVSENPDFKPMIFRAEQNTLSILGLAVAFQSDVR